MAAENMTERGGKMLGRWRSAKSAAAVVIPFGLGSTKVVVLGQENFFTCICAFFNIIKHLFGGF